VRTFKPLSLREKNMLSQNRMDLYPATAIAQDRLDFQLINASGKGEEAKVRELLEKNADPNANFNGFSAVMAASSHGQVGILKILSEKKAKLLPGIKTAATFGYSDVVDFILTNETLGKILKNIPLLKESESLAQRYQHQETVEMIRKKILSVSRESLVMAKPPLIRATIRRRVPKEAPLLRTVASK
jgi:hypothetical protein